MQRTFLRFPLAFVAGLSLLIWGCTKIDTTELGADLIPPVDNINTFADTLYLATGRQENVDTARLFRTENHVLGRINDAVFGNTNADIFVQLKPTFYPFYFGSLADTILPSRDLDSVVLCLAYKGFYGDTTTAQNIKVYAINNSSNNFVDTISHGFQFEPDGGYTSDLLGQASVRASDLSKLVYIRQGKDSVTNQIRIKLSDAFLSKLKGWDSTSTSAANAYRSDSLFKTFFKGFAIVSDNATPGTGGLFSVNLSDALTRLEVHYSKKTRPVADTTYPYTSFALSVGTTIPASATANHIKRDTSAAEYATAPAAGAMYIQSEPGTAVKLSIPGLNNYPNRIIHRAELILEQIPGDPLVERYLTSPAYLYLDLIDTSSSPRYKPVYYDLSPNSPYYPDLATQGLFFPSGGVDFNYYGGFVKTTTDAFGTRNYYTFNLTRYVQNMITKKGVNYSLRVAAPYILNYYGFNLTYSNNLGFGRVKLASDTHVGYRPRLRIVYSELK